MLSPRSASGQLSAQWTGPGDVFSVLLAVGGDVVGRALAQLVGSRITPVAFSFGWVAFAITAVMSAIGQHHIMPTTDWPCKVINGRNGNVRDNSSWIIGRVMRDFETWMDDGQPGGPIRTRMEEITVLRLKDDNNGSAPRDAAYTPRKVGLCVSIYKAEKARPGYPGHDLVYFAGFVISALQLGIAAIPAGLHGDWSIILVTCVGIALSFTTGAIPQWAHEKWSCRTSTSKTIVLTRGNGSQHAIVIIGDGKGLDLEDLAANSIDARRPSPMATAVLSLLAILWILLLITAAGIKQNTWFLLALSGLGSMHNIYVAGSARLPRSYGMPLVFQRVICELKIMDTLFKVEEEYPFLGRSMLETFFPGKLSKREEATWAEYERIAEKKKTGRERSLTV